MRIVHIVAGLWKNTGGPAEVIPNLCQAQAEAGAKVILCSIDGDNAQRVIELQSSGVEVYLFRSLDNTVRYSPDMAKFLKSLQGIDIVHNHGHWLWPNWFSRFISEYLNAPLVTTPHGTLVPGMLRRSRRKKGLAWVSFDRRLIAQATVIHALSFAEKNGMASKLGCYSDKVQVVPNGVYPAENPGNNTGHLGGTLLFLSRVGPIKGIIQLLTAWKTLAPRFPEWRLKIVGPIDTSIRSEVEALCLATSRVELAGPIYHKERWEEYRNAAAFILPSMGEGLPTVLLEAAAYGLPIITTKEANFDELYRVGGCLLSAQTSDGINTTLTSFFSMTGEERKAIGQRALNLVQAEYDWQSIALRWLVVYSNALNEREN